MKKDSVNASFCAFHNTSTVKKTRREGRRRGDGEILIFMVFLRLPSASGGATIQLLLGQDLLYHPRRTLAIAQRCIHIVGRVLREIRKPGELCASRDTACIPFATVSGGFPCLCVVWGIIEPVANNNPPQQERISALFAQAVSAKRAVDVPSTAERLSNGLTVVPLDR